MPFRFRLQRVLDLREAELTQARGELTAALGRLHAAEASLERFRIERTHLLHAHQLPLDRPVTPTVLRARVLGAGAARARVEEAERLVQALGATVETHRTRVVEARRAVRILEKLKARRRDLYRRETEAQERRGLDDIQGRGGDRRPAGSASLARRSG